MSDKVGTVLFLVPLYLLRMSVGLKLYNNWPTFPQLIIKGEFVGGLDVVGEMVQEGKLQELLG